VRTHDGQRADALAGWSASTTSADRPHAAVNVRAGATGRAGSPIVPFASPYDADVKFGGRFGSDNFGAGTFWPGNDFSLHSSGGKKGVIRCEQHAVPADGAGSLRGFHSRVAHHPFGTSTARIVEKRRRPSLGQATLRVAAVGLHPLGDLYQSPPPAAPQVAGQIAVVNPQSCLRSRTPIPRMLHQRGQSPSRAFFVDHAIEAVVRDGALLIALFRNRFLRKQNKESSPSAIGRSRWQALVQATACGLASPAAAQ